MKNNLKKALVALNIIAAFAFVAWVALFLVLGFTSGDFVQFLLLHGQAFLYCFELTFTGHFEVMPLIVVGLCALLVILLVVGLIIAIAKRRAKSLFWGIALVFLFVPAVAYVSVFDAYFPLSPLVTPLPIEQVIFRWVLLVVTALDILAAIVTWIVGIIEICKHPGRSVLDTLEETQEEPQAEYVLAADAEVVAEEPATVEETEPEVEPVPMFIPEPEPEAEPEVEPEPKEPEQPQPEKIEVPGNPSVVVVNNSAPAPQPQPAPEKDNGVDGRTLELMIKDIVRDVIRDEMARTQLSQPKEEKPTSNTETHTITGATFGGPLVVQYFYGSPMAAAPAPQPQPAPAPVQEPAPAPAPVVVEAPAPVVVEEPKPVVVEEPAPVVVEAPAPAPVVEAPAPAPAPVVVPEQPKAPIVRISFEERIVDADKEMKDNYNELKNEILSWGVKSRISNSGDTFRLHRKTYIKITVAGKSLKLYFALDPKDYIGSTIPVQDAGEKNTYAEIPLVFKVKSPLSLKRAKQLIQDVMEKDGLEQGTVESVNWVKEIKASLKK